jgi:hypothetical protein
MPFGPFERFKEQNSMSETDKPTNTGDPDALGDAGKAALAAERKRANDAEKALREADAKLQQLEDANKTELERALSKVSELEAANATLAQESGAKDLTILRLNTGIDEGLPKNLILRLQGEDEDSFKADAASLKELIPDSKSDPFPKADPSQGPRGGKGTPSNADMFAEQVGDF